MDSDIDTCTRFDVYVSAKGQFRRVAGTFSTLAEAVVFAELRRIQSYDEITIVEEVRRRMRMYRRITVTRQEWAEVPE